VITNGTGSVTSSPAFLIVNIPPYISEQPQSQTVKAGAEASFFVGVGGSEPFTYQWRFHGTNLPGATSSSYSRAPVQTNHTGPYSVLITNVAGWTVSSNAALTVMPPTIIVIQSLALLPDRRARLIVHGETNQNCAIEHSTNLNGWTELIELLNTNGIIEIIDDSASNAPLRFYRARQ
jgi:hypothetical protein